MEDLRAQDYRAALGRFATGVAVVTAHGEDGPRGMTANALCSLSLDPLLLLVCFDNGARTLPLVKDAGRFGVNVLRAGRHELSRVFASKTPEAEKFAGVPWSLRDEVPVLDEDALAWATCEVRELIPGGDHTIAIGAVGDVGHDPDGAPLVWFSGGYHELSAATLAVGRDPKL